MKTFLAADVGNTSISVAEFHPSDSFPSPMQTQVFPDHDADFEALKQLFASDPARLIVASVCRPAHSRLLKWVQENAPLPVHALSHHDLPLSIAVPEPDRVGIDRLLGAVAANQLRDSNRPAVVIDAGSAITVDTVDRSGEFLGGVIMAGFEMQTRALAEHTDLIPLVDPGMGFQPPPIIGRNSTEAIQSGIFWGTIGSIREIVRHIQQAYGEVELFITGGDMQQISDHLPQARFHPHLVLQGIALSAKSLL